MLFYRSSWFLVLVFFLLFSPYFLKAQLNEPDSYAFVLHICRGNEIELLSGAEIVFGLLPCNFFGFKLLLFGLGLLCLLVFQVTGKIFNSSHGWMAPYFLLGSPLWFEFLKFEDDQLAFPFIFLSLLFGVKFLKQKKFEDYIFSVCFAAAALLFWKGAIFNLIIVFALWPIGLVAVHGILLVIGNSLTGNLKLNFYVYENFPLIGLLNQYWLLLGFYAIPTFLWPYLTYWTLIVLLRAKYMFWLGLILSLLCTNVFERFSKNQKLGFTGILIAVSIISSIAVFDIPINQEQHEAILFAESFSVNTNQELRNDLVYGYYMQWLGFTAYNTPGDYNLVGDYEKDFYGVVLSTYPDLNCFLVKSFGKNYVYNC